MARFVHPLRRKPRCTPDVRLRRVLTRRGARCNGAHPGCPACKRVQLPAPPMHPRPREARRLRFGTDAVPGAPRARRRRMTRRCH